MRHRVARRKLNRSPSHRKALRQNVLCALFEHHRIITTVAKAKEMRPHAERLITLAKQKDLARVRRAVSLLGSNQRAKDVTRHLFDDLGPAYLDRPGGYTRILRLSERRLGDGSEKVIFELVDQQPVAGVDDADED